MQANNHKVKGTLSGTFLSIMPNIESHDILKTAILATIGAVVSFTISWLLNKISKKE